MVLWGTAKNKHSKKTINRNGPPEMMGVGAEGNLERTLNAIGSAVAKNVHNSATAEWLNEGRFNADQGWSSRAEMKKEGERDTAFYQVHRWQSGGYGVGGDGKGQFSRKINAYNPWGSGGKDPP